MDEDLDNLVRKTIAAKLLAQKNPADLIGPESWNVFKVSGVKGRFAEGGLLRLAKIQ